MRTGWKRAGEQGGTEWFICVCRKTDYSINCWPMLREIWEILGKNSDECPKKIPHTLKMCSFALISLLKGATQTEKQHHYYFTDIHAQT